MHTKLSSTLNLVNVSHYTPYALNRTNHCKKMIGCFIGSEETVVTRGSATRGLETNTMKQLERKLTHVTCKRLQFHKEKNSCKLGYAHFYMHSTPM